MTPERVPLKKVRAIGVLLPVATFVLGAAEATAQTTQQAAPCREQLRFLKPTSQGVSSVQALYYLRVRNTGDHACVAPHFFTVEVPRATAASIDVRPRVGGDLAAPVDLTRPLVIQAGKSVVAAVLVDTPCGHIVGTSVGVKIVFVVDEWLARPKTSIHPDLCTREANRVEVWPLAHA